MSEVSTSDFSTEVAGQNCMIYVPEVLGKSIINTFKELSNGWFLHPVDAFIFDFKNTKSIESQFYQPFLQFRSVIKNSGKTIFSINLTPYLVKQVKSDGLEHCFNPIANVTEVQRKMSKTNEERGRIDLDFIAPFLKGVKSTFEVQCKTPLNPVKPYIKSSPLENISIAGVLSLTSDNFRGTVVLAFPEEVFLKVYENMFDEKHDKITDESQDAAGELLNIIYGTAKVELNQKGFNFPKSLPTVMKGKELVIRQVSDSKTVVIPFDSVAGTFYLEIEFEKSVI